MAKVRAKVAHTQPVSLIFRSEGEEFEHTGEPYEHVEVLEKSAADGDGIDLVKAQALLQSRGYKADTPEAAQAFIDGLKKKERQAFLADLAAFDE